MTTKKIDKTVAKKNTTQAPRKKTGAMGSPAFIFDARQVEIFGMYRATQETMAEYYGVSIDTIARRMKDQDSDFCKAYKKGSGLCLMRLREAQVKKALTGDSTMLIWLGKVLLGQRETLKNEIDVTQPIKLIVDKDDMNA